MLTSDQLLKHGYTLAIVHELTTAAVHTERFCRGRDHADRIDIAWSAIVEHLYASQEPPTRGELLRAGMAGIRDYFRAEDRHRGIPQDRRRHDFSVNFERYWDTFAQSTPSPEQQIVERIALEQIWTALTPAVRSAFTALAVWDDYELAAKSADKTRGQFYSQISYARRVFLRLWHDGETPSRPWGRDRRPIKKKATPLSTAKTIRKRRRQAQRNQAQSQGTPGRNQDAARSAPVHAGPSTDGIQCGRMTDGSDTGGT